MTDTDTLRKRAEAATPGPWACTRSIPQEGFECFWIKAQPNPAKALCAMITEVK